MWINCQQLSIKTIYIYIFVNISTLSLKIDNFNKINSIFVFSYTGRDMVLHFTLRDMSDMQSDTGRSLHTCCDNIQNLRGTPD